MLGFTVINATIRADNVPGLAYYTKMGFREYKVDADVHLARGQVPRGGQQIQQMINGCRIGCHISHLILV